MDYYKELNFLFGVANNTSHTGHINLKGRNYYCLQYNHGGIINVTVDEGEPVEITGPSLLITYPGRDFIFGSGIGSSWLHNAMGFTGNKVQEYIHSGLLPIEHNPPLFPVKDSVSFFTLFQRCCFYISQGERFHHRAAYAFEGLLLQLYEEINYKHSSGGLSRQIHELSQQIIQFPDKIWDFTVEAENMNISYAHFRRLFKQVTGSSPQKYLQQGKLSHAAELLLTTDMPIKEVAYATGIEDIHYFTRIFSLRYDIPPGKFREEHNNTNS